MPVSKHKKKPRKKPPQAILDKRQAAKKAMKETNAKTRAPAPKEAMFAKARQPHKHDSIDFTKNGKCSGCGACCSSILPITEAEKAALREYASTNGIRSELPALPKSVIDMQCPLLDRTTGKCRAYPVRPAVCRAYRCNRSDDENLTEYLWISNQADMPVPYNLWELFGKTGLRTDDGEITPENANRADLVDPSGKKHPVQVGRPVGFTTVRGERYHAAMCLNLMEKSMQIFYDGKIIEVDYLDIESME